MNDSVEDLTLAEITYEQLDEANSAIADFITTYDSESINMIMDSLAEYRIPEEYKSYFDRLREMTDKMDWQAARAQTEEYMKMRGKNNG